MTAVCFIAVVLISAILAIVSAEYQDCYQKKQEFSFTAIKTHFLEKPMHFIAFLVIDIAFAVLAIVFQKEKNLTLVQLPQYVIFWECVLLGAWIDFRTKKIPNPIFLLLLGVRAVGILAEMAFYSDRIFDILLSSFSGMLLGGIILLVFRLISRGGLGAGDIKLFALIGFYFGVIPMMNILFYTTFFSALTAIFLLITKKAKMKSTLALGPFAFIGLNIYYILLS